MLNPRLSYQDRSTRSLRVLAPKRRPTAADLERRARGLQRVLIETNQLAAASAARNIADALAVLAEARP